MGRSLLQGTIPIKDILDQRGPIMYFIYAFAAFIKSNNFLGLYVIELINVLIIYALSFKLVKAVNIEVLSPILGELSRASGTFDDICLLTRGIA